jgi:hypothetical protein
LVRLELTENFFNLLLLQYSPGLLSRPIALIRLELNGHTMARSEFIGLSLIFLTWALTLDPFSMLIATEEPPSGTLTLLALILFWDLVSGRKGRFSLEIKSLSRLALPVSMASFFLIESRRIASVTEFHGTLTDSL